METLQKQLQDLNFQMSDFERNEPVNRQEAIESLRNEVNGQLHDLALVLTGESENSEPTSPMIKVSEGDTSQAPVPASPKGEFSAAVKDSKKYRDLHLRVLNLERRMASLGENSGRRNTRRQSQLYIQDPLATQAIIDDSHHELHLRLVTLLNETRSLQDQFQKINDKDEVLRDIEIPNFGNYVSYQKRLQSLEERAGLYAKIADVESLIRDVVSVRNPMRQETKVIRSEGLNYTPQIEALNSQIAELKQSLSEMQKQAVAGVSPQPIVQIANPGENTPISNPAPITPTADFEVPPWEKTVSTLQKAIAQRVTRSELDMIARNKPTTMSRDDGGRVDLVLREKIDSLDGKLTYFWEEFVKTKNILGEKSKALDRLEAQLGQYSTTNDNTLQRLRIELKSQIGDIHNLLESQTDNPDALKNVTSLKVVVMKLQRDFRELTASMESKSRLEMQIPTQSEPLSPVEDLQFTLQNNPGGKDLPSVLKRHDAEIRHIGTQMNVLMEEINDLKQGTKRQTEASNQAYLRYMEEVKTEMDTIVSKLNDGLKLTQRDFEKISELFDLVGNKGDRVDLEGKAGKEDLKRAAHLLAHRVTSI